MSRKISLPLVLLSAVTASSLEQSFLEKTSDGRVIMSEDVADDVLFFKNFWSKKKPSELQNICINGKDPKKLTQKEKLLEFVEGPCVPVTIVPPLMGSKLTVNIDCETLRRENPEIFASCGWDRCTKSSFMRRNAPKSEYKLWISDMTGPLSLLFPKSSKCWANLIQQDYDASERLIKNRYKSPKGVKVTVHKSLSVDDQQCGFSALNNLFELPVKPDWGQGFEAMKDGLVEMGYQVGLTLYGAPYDWRMTTLASGLPDALNDTIRQAHALTGKPTVFVAHSLGNLGTLRLLNTLTLEDKKKYVHNFVSIENPWVGSPSAVKNFIGGSDDFWFKNKYGLNYTHQEKMFKSIGSAIDVTLKDPFTQFKGEAWLNEWQKRQELEADNKTWAESFSSSSNYPFKWFPSPLNKCFKNFTLRDDACRLYQYNSSDVPVVTIGKENYTASQKDMDALLEKYVDVINTTTAKAIFNDYLKSGIQRLENPGVPMTMVYASHLPTVAGFKWNKDPREKTTKDLFSIPDQKTYQQGDGTITTSAVLMPAFKWAWEFDNGVKDAQPVKTVELCSIFNNKNSVYDKTESDKPYKIEKNEYVGLPCDCIPKEGEVTTGEKCNHVNPTVDSKVIGLVKDVANANFRVSDVKQTQAYKLSNAQIIRLEKVCPLVGVGSEFFNNLLKEVKSI